MGQMVATARDGVMTNVTAGGRIYDPAAVFVGLFTALTPRGVNTVIGDLTEPTGDPGDRQAVTAWGTAYLLNDGSVVRDGPLISWRPADDTEACTVLGWFWATADSAGSLLEYAFFDNPIPLPDETYAVNIVPRLVVDPSGTWEASVVIDG